MAKRNMSPTVALANWQAGMNGATTTITDGVNAVSVAPGQLAAAQANLWQQQVSSAATKTKWANRVGAVSLQNWKNDMIQKGVGRIAQGVSNAASPQGKATYFFSQLIPYIQAGNTTATLGPRGTYQQNVTRATNWMAYMHGFNYTPPSGVAGFNP